PPFIEVAADILEVTTEELLVVGFRDQVKTMLNTVQGQCGIINPRDRNPGGLKDPSTQSLADVSGVLHGIIQRNLMQSVKTLAWNEFIEIQSQSRLIIRWPEA